MIINHWKLLLSSKFFFPSHKIKKVFEKKWYRLSDDKIKYFESLNKKFESNKIKCKVDGIEILLYGDNQRVSEN
jgi:hypothetical protein